MSHQAASQVGSGTVGSLTVRLSDDLHEAARRAAGGRSLNAFVAEAIAEKVGRAELAEKLAEHDGRLDRIERQLGIR